MIRVLLLLEEHRGTAAALKMTFHLEQKPTIFSPVTIKLNPALVLQQIRRGVGIKKEEEV